MARSDCMSILAGISTLWPCCYCWTSLPLCRQLFKLHLTAQNYLIMNHHWNWGCQPLQKQCYSEVASTLWLKRTGDRCKLAPIIIGYEWCRLELPCPGSDREPPKMRQLDLFFGASGMGKSHCDELGPHALGPSLVVVSEKKVPSSSNWSFWNLAIDIPLKGSLPGYTFLSKGGYSPIPCTYGEKTAVTGNCHTDANNIREHGHMLGLYIDTTLKLIQDGHRPPAESFKNFLQASSAFIEKTKQEPNNHVLLEEIRKAADASIRRETFIEEQITAIKNSAPTSNISYANIASQGAAKKLQLEFFWILALLLRLTIKQTKLLSSSMIKTSLEPLVPNLQKIFYGTSTTTYKSKASAIQIFARSKSSKAETLPYLQPTR